ncbi:hypothetical protein MKZ38_010483 [Zalerion maritima]|uniref:Uncharacterized protein n=1 Tax=Zalerion maritima TaxID=339359 RepID=A0AAD5WV32_9PEZI|nr:hypothetical protein MKZ38_010483 [Zalerion maritima]
MTPSANINSALDLGPSSSSTSSPTAPNTGTNPESTPHPAPLPVEWALYIAALGSQNGLLRQQNQAHRDLISHLRLRVPTRVQAVPQVKAKRKVPTTSSGDCNNSPVSPRRKTPRSRPRRGLDKSKLEVFFPPKIPRVGMLALLHPNKREAKQTMQETRGSRAPPLPGAPVDLGPPGSRSSFSASLSKYSRLPQAPAHMPSNSLLPSTHPGFFFFFFFFFFSFLFFPAFLRWFPPDPLLPREPRGSSQSLAAAGTCSSYHRLAGGAHDSGKRQPVDGARARLQQQSYAGARIWPLTSPGHASERE